MHEEVVLLTNDLLRRLTRRRVRFRCDARVAAALPHSPSTPRHVRPHRLRPCRSPLLRKAAACCNKHRRRHLGVRGARLSFFVCRLARNQRSAQLLLLVFFLVLLRRWWWSGEIVERHSSYASLPLHLSLSLSCPHHLRSVGSLASIAAVQL